MYTLKTQDILLASAMGNQLGLIDNARIDGPQQQSRGEIAADTPRAVITVVDILRESARQLGQAAGTLALCQQFPTIEFF